MARVKLEQNIRKELARKGILLFGPVAPKWFTLQSDGCSVPTRIGKFFLKATQSRAACFIHDFEYYLLAIQWERVSAEWKGARMGADWNLKRNRALVAKNKVFGWIYSRLYFRGVRVGGKHTVREPRDLAMPPTLGALKKLKSYLDKPITKLAKAKLEEWEERLSK
jgi:hypothetical protein